MCVRPNSSDQTAVGPEKLDRPPGMARHCGKPIGDVIYISGAGRDHWPSVEAPFSYTNEGGRIYYGLQQIRHALPTSVNHHLVDKYYPIKGTNKACQIVSIEGDQALVNVKYDAQAQVVFPRQEKYPLSMLLLVKDYSSPCGRVKEGHSSVIPHITGTPPKTSDHSKGSNDRSISKCPGIKKPPMRGARVPAIVVGNPNEVYAKLIELSPGEDDPVTLAITHKGVSGDMLTPRTFNNMTEISELYYKQGSMDESNQGLSCGVEAVCNTGFEVTAGDFVKQAAVGVDASAFVARELAEDADAHDDYMDNTGGGNNIPPNQMFSTMEGLSSFVMDPSPHRARELLGEPNFWQSHQWAIVQIPVCGGHWVSMEKIIYRGQPAVCLREGRGNTMYDFITSPDGGGGERLPLGMCSNKRKRKRA